MKYPFLFLWLLFHHAMLPTGFIAGTLIKTPDGYVAVEQLKKGDKIVGGNIEGFFDIYAIKDIKKRESKKLVKITTDSDALFVSPDQRIISANKLTKADELKPGAIIFGMDGSHEIKNIEIMDEVVAFFVSAQSIAVANASRSLLQSIGAGASKALLTLSRL